MAATSPGITSAFLASGSLLHLTGQNKVMWLVLVTRKSGKVHLAGYTVILGKIVTLLGKKKKEKLGSGSHQCSVCLTFLFSCRRNEAPLGLDMDV